MSNENHDEVCIVMVGNRLFHLRGRRGECPAKGHSESQPSRSRSLQSHLKILTASEDDAPLSRKFIRWNEYQGPYFTLQFGAGILYDYGAFAQDQDSKRQIAMFPGNKVRDFRVLSRKTISQNQAIDHMECRCHVRRTGQYVADETNRDHDRNA